MNGSPNTRFTGRHMLMIMLAFFGTVFTANMTMVYFATHSWTGLVVKNSYVASQEFDQKTEEMLRAAQAVHVTTRFAAGQLTFHLKGNDGMPVQASSVTVSLGRPSNDSADHQLALTPDGAGQFSAKDDLAPGQWSGSISAEIPGYGSWSRPVLITVQE